MNKKYQSKLDQWKKNVKETKERKYNFDTVSGKRNELLYYPDELNQEYDQK